MKKIFLLFALLINVSVNAQWSAVGTGMNSFVGELTVYNGELYAGGDFTTAGGICVSSAPAMNNIGHLFRV